MSKWHQPLYPEEVTGRHHVRVVFRDGTVIEGRLFYDKDTPWMRVGQWRRIPYWGTKDEFETEAPPVLYNADDQEWHPLPDVKSIELLWDEEEWEQIDLSAARRGDVLVVNGKLWEISGPVLDDDEETQLGRSVGCLDGFVYRSMASCALRRKEAGSNE